MGRHDSIGGRGRIHGSEVLTVAQRTVFLDTSFVVALEAKDDPHHQRAKALDDDLLRDNAVLMFIGVSCSKSQMDTLDSIAGRAGCNCSLGSPARRDTSSTL